MKFNELQFELATTRANCIIRDLVCPDYSGIWLPCLESSRLTHWKSSVNAEYFCILRNLPNNRWVLFVFNRKKGKDSWQKMASSKKIIELYIHKSYEENKLLATMSLI